MIRWRRRLLHCSHMPATFLSSSFLRGRLKSEDLLLVYCLALLSGQGKTPSRLYATVFVSLTTLSATPWIVWLVFVLSTYCGNVSNTDNNQTVQGVAENVAELTSTVAYSLDGVLPGPEEV